MRIVSWNLWWRHGPWQQRRKPIAAVLAETAPDVCGLQEVWGGTDDGAENLAAELADQLGMHWCWAPLPISSRRRTEHGPDMAIGNAVLSRWPILSQAQLSLPIAETEQPRVAVHARIDAPGGPLPFFTTHLTHRPDASGERVAQVRALAGFVGEHLDGSAYPPVVTGDLNAAPESDEVRLLGGLLTAPVVPGLVLLDAWWYADGSEPAVTWDRANPHVGDVGIFDVRIDYVMVGLPRSGKGRVLSVTRAGTRPVEGMVASDHYAVVADLAE